METKSDSIIGFYASFSAGSGEDSNTALWRQNRKKDFLDFIWNDFALSDRFRSLEHKDYGADVQKILFQFEVNPIDYVRNHIKEVENFRPSEKAFGVWIIIDDENFFNKNHYERSEYIEHMMINRLEQIGNRVKRGHMDCDIDRLKSDVRAVFAQIRESDK